MSDLAFFVLSKILIVGLRVESWILCGMVMTLWFGYRSQRSAMLTTGLISIGLATALTMFPLGYPLINGLERHYPPSPPLSHIDGILILGGGEFAARSAYWQQGQLNGSSERILFGARLARQFPQAKVIFSGGSGRLRDHIGTTGAGSGQKPFKNPVEGDVAQDFLLGLGVEPDRLYIEDKARNTYENAIFLYETIKPKSDQHWVLITSAFHMPRSMRSFERAGWTNIVAYPVDYQTGRPPNSIGWALSGNLNMLNTALKEHVGLLVYDLTGR